jgi:hypothetical protein
MSDNSPARAHFTIEDLYFMSDFNPIKENKHKKHVDKVLRKMGR